MTEERNAIVRELGAPLAAGKGWMKFLGFVFIIQGVLAALSIVGILVAWLPIWIGVLLLQSAGSLEQAQASGDEVQFRRAMDKLRTYFVVLGVLALVGIAIAIMSMLFWGAVFMAAISNFNF